MEALQVMHTRNLRRSGLSNVPSSFGVFRAGAQRAPAIRARQRFLASRFAVDAGFRWGDWVNWGNAFVNLPVTLTNGTNSAIERAR